MSVRYLCNGPACGLIEVEVSTGHILVTLPSGRTSLRGIRVASNRHNDYIVGNIRGVNKTEIRGALIGLSPPLV